MTKEAGQAFYMYQPGQFLKVFGAAVKQQASGDALKEVASLPPIREDVFPGAAVSSRDRYEIARVKRRRAMLQHRIDILDRSLAGRHTRKQDEVWKAERDQLSAELQATLDRETLLLRRAAEREAYHILSSPGSAIVSGTFPYGLPSNTVYRFGMPDTVSSPGVPIDGLSPGPPANLIRGPYTLYVPDLGTTTEGPADEPPEDELDHEEELDPRAMDELT